MGRRLQEIEVPNLTYPKGTKRLALNWGSPFFEIRYWSEQRIRLNGHAGSLFSVDPDGLKKGRKFVDEYNNVVALGGHSEYAPELARHYVFVADRAMKKS